MLGLEPWISGAGSDHSTNWATTTVSPWPSLQHQACSLRYGFSNSCRYLTETGADLNESFERKPVRPTWPIRPRASKVSFRRCQGNANVVKRYRRNSSEDIHV